MARFQKGVAQKIVEFQANQIIDFLVDQIGFCKRYDSMLNAYSRQISNGSRSVLAGTRRRKLPAAPHQYRPRRQHVADESFVPGTHNPKRMSPSCKNAKPRSMVMPRRFSSRGDRDECR